MKQKDSVHLHYSLVVKGSSQKGGLVMNLLFYFLFSFYSKLSWQVEAGSHCSASFHFCERCRGGEEHGSGFLRAW